MASSFSKSEKFQHGIEQWSYKYLFLEVQNYQMNQHQNLRFAYKRFKSCKKGRILRLVLSLPSSTFPLSWGSLMSRSLAITQRTQRRATHIIMGLHILLRVYSSFNLTLKQSLCFYHRSKMYIHISQAWHSFQWPQKICKKITFL